MASANWSSNLLKKEEEYKRLNAELESKTAHLVREAETLLHQNDSTLSGSFRGQSNLLDNVNPEEILESDEDSAAPRSGRPASGVRTAESRTGGVRQSSGASRHRRGASGASRKKSNKSRVGEGEAEGEGENYVDEFGVDQSTAKAIVADFQKDLAGRVAELEEEVNPGQTDRPDDLLPPPAQEMSAEAQTRFLRAKVRVSEEEIGRLQDEVRKLQEENRKLSQRAKDADEERQKACRSTQTLQTQLEKFRRSSEEATAKVDALEKQLTAVRRESDQIKRQEKQQAAGAQAAEVRLNRALEEVEKYKSELSKSRASKKDVGDAEKRRADSLAQENKKLERQKNELVAGFRKQMKLIDILKRQRMHLEAAKMLQFAEEEFVKALDWEKSS